MTEQRFFMSTEDPILDPQRGINGRTLHGIAVPYNRETTHAGRREVVIPGSFTASIATGRDILALVNHDVARVVGRTKSGNLRFSESSGGLEYELSLPQTPDADMLIGLAKSGDLGGVSIGFTVKPGGEKTVGGVRQLRNLELVEISFVPGFPAYDGTSANLRNATPRKNRAARIMETIK